MRHRNANPKSVAHDEIDTVEQSLMGTRRDLFRLATVSFNGCSVQSMMVLVLPFISTVSLRFRATD